MAASHIKFLAKVSKRKRFLNCSKKFIIYWILTTYEKQRSSFAAALPSATRRHSLGLSPRPDGIRHSSTQAHGRVALGDVFQEKDGLSCGLAQGNALHRRLEVVHKALLVLLSG